MFARQGQSKEQPVVAQSDESEPVVAHDEAGQPQSETGQAEAMRLQGQGIAEHVIAFAKGEELEWRGAHFVLPLHNDMHRGFLSTLGLAEYCPLADQELRQMPNSYPYDQPVMAVRAQVTDLTLEQFPGVILRRSASLSEAYQKGLDIEASLEELPDTHKEVQASLSYVALRQEVDLTVTG